MSDIMLCLYICCNTRYANRPSCCQIIFWLSAVRFPLADRLHEKNLILLCYLNKTWIWSTDFGKYFQHKIWRKFVLWKPRCLLWICRRRYGETNGRFLPLCFEGTGKMDLKAKCFDDMDWIHLGQDRIQWTFTQRKAKNLLT